MTVGRIDVEPYVELDGWKGRATHAIAKGVHRRPGFSAEGVNRETLPRCQIDLYVFRTPEVPNPHGPPPVADVVAA